MYADPDPYPQNLMNEDPDQVRLKVNEIAKLILNHLLKVEKKKSNLYLYLRDKLLF